MTRTFLQADELHDLVAEQFGSNSRLTGLHRLTGGSKKGVYRLGLDGQKTVILYVWAAGENYWPPSPTVPDDPFTDASGAELFAASHAALTAAGVRIPRLLMLDRDGRYLDADIALLEDAGALRLEALMERDPAAAAAPLSALGDALRHHLRDRVAPRQEYALVHGELGPDHVLVAPSGEPIVIDIKGLTSARHSPQSDACRGPSTHRWGRCFTCPTGSAVTPVGGGPTRGRAGTARRPLRTARRTPATAGPRTSSRTRSSPSG
ncbi:hypothetical protein OG400_27985 [Micromonospora ureilytica]|uniref:hypothetical protein n=1 Tax=Micromonospora ureilytica TaxID=709868 RepID=UPI002E139A67|nr:hypothetical protein OG400_27985 [Micromonospora ureilytica]